MIERREWRWVVWVTLVVTAASWLPYLVGWAATPSGTHFTGLVYNPLDGHSYIAKMRVGAEGSWLFELVYSAEPQQGVPIYLFFLSLGHLARWLSLPLLAVYHGVRTLAGVGLSFGLYRLTAHLADRERDRRLLYLLAVLGSGLGWLAALLGRNTIDLWVVEAFPFAALLANAHFPVAMALMAWSAHWGLQLETSRRAGGGLMVGAVLLGGVQPFGLVPLMGGLVGMCLVCGIRQRRMPWRSVVWTALAALAALPYPIYTLWALRADPLLRAWNAQNLTPSPPLVDWLLGFGLLAPLALAGIVAAARRRWDADGLLIGWLLATVVGVALPLDLARRLSLGMAIPTGMLAGLGYIALAARLRGRRRNWPKNALVLFSAATPLFLLVLGVAGVLGGHSLLYLSTAEWEALSWLEDQASRDDVVLCAPEMGIFVPAWAGQHVVYGHPFETVDAETREAWVEQFWAGERDADWLDDLDVDLVFYGPRERLLGAPPPGEPLFQVQDVAIYRRR